MTRPTISRSDFHLRLFVDTNVLIDYLENFDGNKAKSFLELFKNTDFENIELVTSDYVLWELYGYFRKDLYVRKMMTDPNRNWGFNRARKGMKEFKGVDREEMEEFGNAIKNMVDQLEEVITIQRDMDKETEGFSEIIERLLQCSKFSYKDTMVLVSALYTQSHILVTIDEQFREEGRRSTELEEERESLPTEFLGKSGLGDLKFEPPSEFSSEEGIKQYYQMWFEERNKEKEIGKVIKYWSELKAIGVECFNDCTIKEGDYIYIVKFIEAKDIVRKLVKIEKGYLRDYETEEPIKEGKKVTIKLPDDSLEGLNLENAIIFLSAE